MLLILAWRNLWRNRRRTFITMGSIFFAVILATFMMSIKEGVYTRMIDSMVGAFTGYAQVHQNGYWEEKTLDNSMAFSDDLAQKIESTDGVVGYLPRIESFAMAAGLDVTKGAQIIGFDPEKETAFSGLNERVSKGEFLGPDDKAVLVGVGLAEYLDLGVGDTIVVLGAGYHGISAAGKYPIKGIIKFGSPELSAQLIFLPIKEAQWLFGMEGMYTNITLIPEDPGDAPEIVKDLRAQLGEEYEVMNWQELTPELVNMIETDRVEGYVFMFILYMVISFGIFGTMLMMLAERKHEFGVLVAVGMKRIKLGIMVFFEVVTISVLGAFLGIFGAIIPALIMYLYPVNVGGDMGKMYEEYGMEAVLQTSMDPSIFITQAVVIAMIAAVIAIYPIFKLLRLDAIQAMRS